MNLWLYRKFIFQKRVLLEPTTLFSLMGISLGVAFLIVTMAGFSGFTKSLKSSIIDVTGDVVVFKRGARIGKPKKLANEIRETSSEVKELLGFVNVEVLVANQGKISAVLLQGLDWETAQKLPELNRRIVAQVNADHEGFGHGVYMGKVVAQNLKLRVGDSFKAIFPKVSKSSATQVSPRLQDFYVHTIVDLGKYDYNERMVIAPIESVQTLAEMGKKINGFRIKLHDSEKAPKEAEKIQEVLGWDFSVRDWSQNNRSLFKAIRYEKTVLFFVMLIMVVAAFFNVSTTLFLGVLRRYSQISVMRALGLKRRDIIVLFCVHGMVLGVIGLVLGVSLGLLMCLGFENLQKIYPIMPEDVYRMSSFETQVNTQDIIWVIVATLFICFISTLSPARRGAKLSPVEGLKYE